MEFSEYEIALLWTQYKDNFGSGRVNRIQLTQMLRQVCLSACLSGLNRTFELRNTSVGMTRGQRTIIVVVISLVEDVVVVVVVSVCLFV